MSTTATPSTLAGESIQGRVHGGQQPIVGAHVYLLAANTTGYGGSGIAASSLNASVSLLTSSAGSTLLDTSGGPTNGDYYVTTDSTGAFSLGGDYTCTAGQQVYLYALGGNPGAGTNSAAGLLAAVGTCPAAGNFAATVPFVWINEVSTVAAAYAFAGFATDATHVSSSGTALAQTGIANAFANAANLASISTGAALLSTPSGTGTAPQAEIDTIANILAVCVNSTGPGSAACSTLFGNTLSAGASGTRPTDTATAAINIAHNPGANVATLYNSTLPAVAFAPALSAQPGDFTVVLQFQGGTLAYAGRPAIDAAGNPWFTNLSDVVVLSNSGAVLSGANGYALFGSYNPQPAGGIAIDPLGNAWITAGNALVKLSSSGAMLSPSNGYTGGHLSGAAGVAIDAHYIVWVANYSNNSVSAFYADGAPVTSGVGITGGGLKQPASIAIDASNNIWIADYYYLTTVVELSNSGSFLSGTTGYDNVNGVLDPSDIEIDRQGNAWITNSEYNTVTELSSTGAYVSPQYGYSGGGINFPTGVAIDGAGNAWISSSGQNYFPSLGEISSQGVFLSGANGYAAGSRANAGPLVGPSGPAIDGSGNIWIANNTGAPNALSIIDEFIGLAAPVVTPTAVAVQMNALGSRP